MSDVKGFVPPLAVTRILGTYSFEDGSFVSIVAGGKAPTADLIDMAETLIGLKRYELLPTPPEGDAG
jgi:hypothetical protein